MSNIISLNKSNERSISMSNQGTDCFFELIEKSAYNINKTANQEKLIEFLKEKRTINEIAPGTVSFDIVEMPWNKETLKEDVVFMMRIIENAMKLEMFEELGYSPNMEIVIPWLKQFAHMIYMLDKEYIYGNEEKEIVNGGISQIYKVLISDDSNAKRRLLFYLDWYMDPYYKNDLSNLYEPLKEMLQDVVINDNEDDVIEEALHLLEAYTEPPFEILMENIDNVSNKFLEQVKILVRAGEPEYYMIELTGTLKEKTEKAVQLILTEVSNEEVDLFCELYEAAGIKVFPAAIDFFKKYGGAFRDSYIVLNQPEYNDDVFLDCFGISYIRYVGSNPKGKKYKELLEFRWVKNLIDDVKEFAKQEVCPIASIGYYYPPNVFIGEDGTLYCVYEYKDEIGVFNTPDEILEEQFGNIYPIGVNKLSKKYK